MGKVNVLTKRAPVYDWQTFSFTDPNTVDRDETGEAIDGTGEVYTFRLRALDDMERFAMLEFADKLTVRYVTGGYRDQADAIREKPEVWLMEDEAGLQKPITVTEESLRIFAEIEWMQGVKRDIFDDTPRDDVYLARELAVMVLVAPSVFNDLRAAVRKIKMERGKKKAPLTT